MSKAALCSLGTEEQGGSGKFYGPQFLCVTSLPALSISRGGDKPQMSPRTCLLSVPGWGSLTAPLLLLSQVRSMPWARRGLSPSQIREMHLTRSRASISASVSLSSPDSSLSEYPRAPSCPAQVENLSQHNGNSPRPAVWGLVHPGRALHAAPSQQGSSRAVQQCPEPEPTLAAQQCLAVSSAIPTHLGSWFIHMTRQYEGPFICPSLIKQ